MILFFFLCVLLLVCVDDAFLLQIVSKLREVSGNHAGSNFVSLISMGKSHEGRNMQALKVSANKFYFAGACFPCVEVSNVIIQLHLVEYK